MAASGTVGVDESLIRVDESLIRVDESLAPLATPLEAPPEAVARSMTMIINFVAAASSAATAM